VPIVCRLAPLNLVSRWKLLGVGILLANEMLKNAQMPVFLPVLGFEPGPAVAHPRRTP
jgi:hypothetical protein